ncbi:MAG: hypothetical protein JW982_03000 [Spirochaetes bacterium]|nr:hypothetical protein [Spirochaetota bacterium]
MEVISSIDDFEKALTLYLELDLKHYSRFFVRDTIRAFDLGCYPWHESIELSFLTDYEPDLNEKYIDNPADWRLYNFTSNCACSSWYAGEKLL